MSFPGIAKAANLRRKILPGLAYVRYHKGDCEALARSSVVGEAHQPQAVA